jgi:hypothetical protein
MLGYIGGSNKVSEHVKFTSSSVIDATYYSFNYYPTSSFVHPYLGFGHTRYNIPNNTERCKIVLSSSRDNVVESFSASKSTYSDFVVVIGTIGLNVSIETTVATFNGKQINVPFQKVDVPANTVSYIYLDDTGILNISSILYESTLNKLLMGKVTTDEIKIISSENYSPSIYVNVDMSNNILPTSDVMKFGNGESVFISNKMMLKNNNGEFVDFSDYI